MEVLALWQKFILALSNDINNRGISTTIPPNFIPLFIGMHITCAQLTYYIRMSIFIKYHIMCVHTSPGSHSFAWIFSLPLALSIIAPSLPLTLFEMGILIPVIMWKSSTEYTLIINYYWLEMLIISIGGPWAVQVSLKQSYKRYIFRL